MDCIEEKLISFKREIKPDEFRDAVKSLTSGLDIHKNVVRMKVDGVSAEVVERDARALSAFFKVLDEVVEIEANNAKDRASGGKALSLDTMVEKLRAALTMTRYNVRQKHGYGVYVTSLEEMRGLEFEYVFIVGLNEGELPTRYVPEILLPLVSQKENRERQPYLQRHLFYQALCSFKKNLFLLSAKQSEEVHLVRSSFIDELVKIIDPTFIREATPDSDPASREQHIYNIQQLIFHSSRFTSHGHELSTMAYHELLPRNLPRCVASETDRYKNDTESEFHGRINKPDLIDSLNRRFSAEDRVFSSSQIESLSRCGFQFFARRILKISELPDIETSLSPTERGAVLHRILFQFYEELSRRGKSADAAHELPLLLEVGRRVLDELGIEHETV